MGKLIVVLAFVGSLLAADTPKGKVFVVDKVSQQAQAANYGNKTTSAEVEHHSAPIVMAAFQSCTAVTFTTDRAAADYMLQTQPGGSVLSNPKGDVLYISPARTLKNMVKDMCKYISGQAQRTTNE
jgi:hypothetical protein